MRKFSKKEVSRNMLKSGLLNALIFVVLFLPVDAQKTEKAREVWRVLKMHCYQCHAEGKAGALLLNNYNDAVANARLIGFVVGKGIMPPWKADPSYRHYLFENLLDSSELKMLTDWSHGYPKAEEVKEKSPADNKREYGKKPDISIAMPVQHRLSGNGKEDFSSFVVHVDLPQAQIVSSSTIIPGNIKRVHHLRIDVDTSTLLLSRFNQQGFLPTDSIGGIPLLEPGFADYVPGLTKFRYPLGFGKPLPNSFNLIFNVHYAPGVLAETDRSAIELEFAPKNTGDSIRIVKNLVGGVGFEDHLIIPHDSVFRTIYRSEAIEKDCSLLSIQAHMHLLGKSMKVYAVTPAHDTIKLVYVPDWDFNWQQIFYFDHLLRLPAGSIIVQECVFDNTIQNPLNPFFPSRDIPILGMKTTDEMAEFYIQYSDYRNGDEHLDLKYE